MKTLKELKSLSKEEFMKINGANEELYNSLHSAKSGWIEIKKEGTDDIHYGYTSTFGEGVSCRINNSSEWYTTSIIKKINWEEKYFDTLNSRYYFTFTEDAKSRS